MKTTSETKVTQLGNSLHIPLPQNLAQEINLSEGSEINITVVNGHLVIKPKNYQKYTFDEIVKEITPENMSISKNRLATLGKDQGKFIVPEDFNDPLPEDILAAFEGDQK